MLRDMTGLKKLSYAEIMATDVGPRYRWRETYGFGYLLDASNPKVIKSLGLHVLNLIMHLAPADSSGYEVCHCRSLGCTKACLNTSGHGGIGDYDTSVLHRCRIARTRLLFEQPRVFLKILILEIQKGQRKARKMGMALAIRLNGTSDILWEKRAPQLFEIFPDVQFLDYTKFTCVMRPIIPVNYHLTYSRSENTTIEDIHREIDFGRNVAVVFSTPELLGTVIANGWLEFKVINATTHDLRYQDTMGRIAGLYFKETSTIGKAVNEDSGFVIQAI